MARLTLVKSATPANQKVGTAATGHRASSTEGEAAKRLLEDQGFVCKRKANGQFEFLCPFHEFPGQVAQNKGANFYVDANTSKYFCQSAACGERGNLVTLERHFGIGEEDDYVSLFKNKDTILKELEANLTPALRKPFYDHGLTDTTIERFRLGYEPEHEEEREGEDGETRMIKIPARYVIPYLEGRRPKFFRYYAPNGDPKWKYTWESGAESTLYNAQDAVGDAEGRVFVCEGEQKAMLLTQLGYAACAVAGASQWKPEWQAAFTHARQVIFVYDNDNPASHNYDKPEKNQKCRKCEGKGLPACIGHNPGQEAALLRLEDIGWRAKNVVLPLPNEQVSKTDVNDFFMRDGHTNADFAELCTGKRATPYKVMSLKEIIATPPEEAEFLIEQGILSKGGRLLIAGKPKVGKSIFLDNLALSLAAGIPFLKTNRFPGFKIDHPTRVLLLDRELSRWSLFKRMEGLIADRAGYQAAEENLLIDHDHMIRLDQRDAYDTLMQLVETNGAEVVMLDTAYKFFGGDVESSSSVMKGFEVLDKVLHKTGCSFVLTHHHKKGQGGASAKGNTDIADPDNVAGSFLWTGWPNATILLNYLNRSVENPFNSIATFTAFRDAAPPEPVALYRDRTSISYKAVETYSHEKAEADKPANGGRVKVTKPDTDTVANMLLEQVPCTEDDFLHMAAGHFGVSIPTLKPYFLDAMSRGDFERTSGKPPILKFKYAPSDEETWEKEHGLPERPQPDNLGEALDMEMVDADGVLVEGLVP